MLHFFLVCIKNNLCYDSSRLGRSHYHIGSLTACTNHSSPITGLWLDEAVFPVQEQFVLVAVVAQGHAPLDAHPRPHGPNHVVGGKGKHGLPRTPVNVEIVDTTRQPRAARQHAQVPCGRQAVTRVPALK